MGDGSTSPGRGRCPVSFPSGEPGSPPRPGHAQPLMTVRTGRTRNGETELRDPHEGASGRKEPRGSREGLRADGAYGVASGAGFPVEGEAGTGSRVHVHTHLQVTRNSGASQGAANSG